MFYDMGSKMGRSHETGDAADKRKKCNAGDGAECTNLGTCTTWGRTWLKT